MSDNKLFYLISRHEKQWKFNEWLDHPVFKVTYPAFKWSSKNPQEVSTHIEPRNKSPITTKASAISSFSHRISWSLCKNTPPHTIHLRHLQIMQNHAVPSLAGNEPPEHQPWTVKYCTSAAHSADRPTLPFTRISHFSGDTLYQRNGWTRETVARNEKKPKKAVLHLLHNEIVICTSNWKCFFCCAFVTIFFTAHQSGSFARICWHTT